MKINRLSSFDLHSHKYCKYFSFTRTSKMKLSVLFCTFSQFQAASSNQQQAVDNRIRHWAMPYYRKMGAIDVEKEIRKPTYNRLSDANNRKMLKIMNSMGSPGPRNFRMSSIWHSYTKSLF